MPTPPAVAMSGAGWAKPLSGTRGVALSVINLHAGMTDVAVPLYRAAAHRRRHQPRDGCSGAIGVRDIWARQDLPDLPPPQSVERVVSLRVVEDELGVRAPEPDEVARTTVA